MHFAATTVKVLFSCGQQSSQFGGFSYFFRVCLNPTVCYWDTIRDSDRWIPNPRWSLGASTATYKTSPLGKYIFTFFILIWKCLVNSSGSEGLSKWSDPPGMLKKPVAIWEHASDWNYKRSGGTSTWFHQSKVLPDYAFTSPESGKISAPIFACHFTFRGLITVSEDGELISTTVGGQKN